MVYVASVVRSACRCFTASALCFNSFC